MNPLPRAFVGKCPHLKTTQFYVHWKWYWNSSNKTFLFTARKNIFQKMFTNFSNKLKVYPTLKFKARVVVVSDYKEKYKEKQIWMTKKGIYFTKFHVRIPCSDRRHINVSFHILDFQHNMDIMLISSLPYYNGNDFWKHWHELAIALSQRTLG